MNYILQVLGIFSYVTAKASVGCLILRLLPLKSRGRKWIIISVIVLTFIINSLNCIFTFVQCDPPKALWENKIPAHCWDPKVQVDFAFFSTGKTFKCDFVHLRLWPWCSRECTRRLRPRSPPNLHFLESEHEPQEASEPLRSPQSQSLVSFQPLYHTNIIFYPCTSLTNAIKRWHRWHR